ncbi:MAG: ATP-dependent helicase HepA [Bacteriovoracaceae bacterium]|jgi:ATP-dependent helicase HepA
MNYFPGQRWMSQTEPELGLGVIKSTEGKVIVVIYPASQTERTYGFKTAPLKRVKFEEGDEIVTHTGEKYNVTEVLENEKLFIYKTKDGLVVETDLNDHIFFRHPEDRLLAGSGDSLKLFNLRQKTIEMNRNWLLSEAKGFQGGRLSLIPHQYYVASKILKRPYPRVLLADEVGLGKTIEAGLILHNLLVSERIERALIILPDSLVYQWFVEMHRKFNLNFTVVNQETRLEEGVNPFLEKQLVITSWGLLRGAETARKLLDQANFDLLVVDEAHQIKWSPEEESMEYSYLKKLSARTPGLLLLTATPETLGIESHFARLHLIDPNRFISLEQYYEDSSHFEELGGLAKKINSDTELTKTEVKNLTKIIPEFTEEWGKEKTLTEMVDTHGTGRIFFRNTRKKMSSEFSFFPRRILHPYGLPHIDNIESIDDDHNLGASFNAKGKWLVDLLTNDLSLKDEKILLICRSKDKIQALEKVLKEEVGGIKTSLFHSGLSMMARDRQAAYFADPNGAKILLCTEIGSEGRNFEFCSHLILLDHPKKPELLEQRIGRLDRIGQKRDVNIHVPYILESWEEVLFDWYNKGIGAYEASPIGAHQIFEEFKADLFLCFQGTIEAKEVIDKTITRYQEIKKTIEEGRDVLVEFNSFEQASAREIVKKVEVRDQEEDLVQFMFSVFENFGVDIEDVDAHSYYIKPNPNMFIPHFPGLPNQGLTITFSRTKALEREEFTFLTWDHPMVRGIMDLILSEDFGNVSLAVRESSNSKNSKTFLECFYTIDFSGPREYEIGRYFPIQSIRVLIDREDTDFTEKWDKQTIDSKITEANKELWQGISKIPRKFIKERIRTAKKIAEARAQGLYITLKEKMEKELDSEIQRMNDLIEKNPQIGNTELRFLENKKRELTSILLNANINLDSFRLIL